MSAKGLLIATKNSNDVCGWFQPCYRAFQNSSLTGYVRPMPRQYVFQPCIPTRAIKVPTGPDWLHEIKHDGYRLIVQRDGARFGCSRGAAMTGPTGIR
jgi:hypothetical protein